MVGHWLTSRRSAGTPLYHRRGNSPGHGGGGTMAVYRRTRTVHRIQCMQPDCWRGDSGDGRGSQSPLGGSGAGETWRRARDLLLPQRAYPLVLTDGLRQSAEDRPLSKRKSRDAALSSRDCRVLLPQAIVMEQMTV